jgi:MFS family permease
MAANRLQLSKLPRQKINKHKRRAKVTEDNRTAQANSVDKLWTNEFTFVTIINLGLFIGFQMLNAPFPFFIKDLGGDEAIAGVAAALFAVSSVIVRPGIGWLLDTFGRKVILVIGMLGMLLLPISYAITSTLVLVIVLRGVHGIMWSAASTAINTVACDIIPRSRFGEGMGMFSIGTAVALAIGPMFGLALIDGDHGYSTLFIVAAAFSAITLLMVLGVKDKVQLCRQDKQSLRQVLLRLISPDALPASVVMLLFVVPYGAIATFIALYSAENGIGSGGTFFLLMAIVIFLVRVVTRKAADQRGEAPIVLISNICLLVGLLGLVLFPGDITFYLAALLFGLGFSVMAPAMQTMAMRTAPVERRGAASSTYLCAFDIGMGLGGVIAGYLIKYLGYSTMFALMALFLLASLGAYAFWARKTPSSFGNQNFLK